MRRDLHLPRGIAVHPSEPLLFWTDWGTAPKIERAGVDGTDRAVIADTNLKWPNGIAVDHDRIYWIDGHHHKIEVTFNGYLRLICFTDS